MLKSFLIEWVTRLNWCMLSVLSIESFLVARCFREKTVYFFFVFFDHHSNGKLDCSRRNLRQMQNQNRKKNPNETKKNCFTFTYGLVCCFFFRCSRCTMLACSVLCISTTRLKNKEPFHIDTTKVCRSIFAYYFMVSVESKMEMETCGGNCWKIENIETVIWRLMWTNHVFSHRTHSNIERIATDRQAGRQAVKQFQYMYEFKL